MLTAYFIVFTSIQKYTDDVALHLYLIMLDSHTSGQLVRPANQYIVVGQVRAPLHSVGVELCVKHMQSSRTGPSIHGCRLYSSLENRKHFNVYNVAKTKHMELSLRYLQSQWIKNTTTQFHSLKTHQLQVRRGIVAYNITYGSITGTNFIITIFFLVIYFNNLGVSNSRLERQLYILAFISYSVGISADDDYEDDDDNNVGNFPVCLIEHQSLTTKSEAYIHTIIRHFLNILLNKVINY